MLSMETNAGLHHKTLRSWPTLKLRVRWLIDWANQMLWLTPLHTYFLQNMYLQSSVIWPTAIVPNAIPMQMLVKSLSFSSFFSLYFPFSCPSSLSPCLCYLSLLPDCLIDSWIWRSPQTQNELTYYPLSETSFLPGFFNTDNSSSVSSRHLGSIPSHLGFLPVFTSCI